MNGIIERGRRGASLTNNLITLRRGKMPMSAISRMSNDKGCYVCAELLRDIHNEEANPSENVLDRIEPLVKELIEARDLPFDDWRIGFKL